MRNNYLPLVIYTKLLQSETPFCKVPIETGHKELAGYVCSCPTCCLFMQDDTWGHSPSLILISNFDSLKTSLV